MKKLLIVLMAFCIACATTALAQDTMKSCDMGKASAAKAPLKTLKGTVKAEGDKITFVNDADQKSWDVMNPETLKGHEGAIFTLAFNPQTNQIAAAGYDGKVRIYETGKGALIRDFVPVPLQPSGPVQKAAK